MSSVTTEVFEISSSVHEVEICNNTKNSIAGLKFRKILISNTNKERKGNPNYFFLRYFLSKAIYGDVWLECP